MTPPEFHGRMKLLSINDSTKVICVVATVCAPACDSHVKFYTTDWKELVASSYLPALPVLDDLSLRPRIRWMSMSIRMPVARPTCCWWKRTFLRRMPRWHSLLPRPITWVKKRRRNWNRLSAVLLFILGIKGSSRNPLLHFDSVESLSIDSDDCTLWCKGIGVYVFYEPENDGGLPLLGQHVNSNFYLFSRYSKPDGVWWPLHLCEDITLDVAWLISSLFIADNKELYGLAGTVHHLVEHEAAYV